MRSNVLFSAALASAVSVVLSAHANADNEKFRATLSGAHSTAKCNGKIFGVEESLTRSSIAEYLSGARVEFILDPLDIGI